MYMDLQNMTSESEYTSALLRPHLAASSCFLFDIYGSSSQLWLNVIPPNTMNSNLPQPNIFDNPHDGRQLSDLRSDPAFCSSGTKCRMNLWPIGPSFQSGKPQLKLSQYSKTKQNSASTASVNVNSKNAFHKRLYIFVTSKHATFDRHCKASNIVPPNCLITTL